jgi:hypothetical protein
MRAVNHPQFLAIGINSELEIEFRNNKIYLLYKERLQCKPKTPIPILPVSFIRKC